MGKLQVNGSAGILNDLTVSGNIFSTNIYPNTTLSYNIGLSSKEYGDGFIRQIFTRHIEPATSVNNDIFICYNNRGGSIRAYAPLDMNGIGSIVNLPIGGGLYWNPYVESATDGTDAASITLHALGVGGGTELRITMANDGNDVINLNPATWIYLQGKAAFRVDDSWLRINETSGFSSGIYTGTSLIRSDNCLQVGSDGAAFIARSDGYGRFGYKLDIGSQLSLWEDNEGGNIWLHSGNGHTNAWEIDSFDGNLRIYTYRENDGTFRSATLDQNNGYWSNAYWATDAGSSQCLVSTGFGDGNFTYLQTSGEFYGASGWAHYLISNHGNGASYYNYVLRLPFYSSPEYKRQTGNTSSVSGWHSFITSENIGSQSVNYANTAGWASSAGDAGTLNGWYASGFIRKHGWWTNGNTSYHADTTEDGIVFAYTCHGVPSTWGTLCTFGYGNGRDYNLQLHGTGNNQLFFRNRSSDYGQGSWQRVQVVAGWGSTNPNSAGIRGTNTGDVYYVY